MTGEMSWIKPDGTDSNGECWEVHAAIAKALRGAELRPFDVYQGPYIRTARGEIWLSSDDGCSGTVTLLQGGPVAWGGRAYSLEIASCYDKTLAIAAARILLRAARLRERRAA